MRNQSRLLTALLAIALAGAGTAAFADDTDSDDSQPAIRFGTFYTNPTAKTNIGGGTKIEGDNVLGFNMDYEFRFAKWVGLDVGAAYTKYPISAQGPGFDTRLGHTQVFPVSAWLLFHPTPSDSPVDWYIGPGMTYSIFRGDLHIKKALQPLFGGRDDISIDNTLGWSARTGVDINIGEPADWAINLDVTYNKLEGDTNNDFVKQFDINPFNFGVGLTYRF